MTPSKGMLIEFEGGDGAGKQTQAKLLAQRFPGRRVEIFTFPDDATAYGALIRAGLNGKHGDFRHADPYLTAALYMADRGLRMAWINDVLEEDGVVICDRYAYSNFAYQGVKFADRAERDTFQLWCTEMEFEALGHRRPDLVLLLNMPPENGQQLVDRRGSARDQHEADLVFLRSVFDEFLVLAERLRWSVIPCTDGRMAIAPPDVIGERVLGEVGSFLARHTENASRA